MGMDIHVYILTGENSEDVLDSTKELEIYRNYDWFGNLSGRNITSEEYDSEYFPRVTGFPPEPYIKTSDAEQLVNDMFFDFMYVKVSAFKAWFEQYHPDRIAGWMRKYDAWFYKKTQIFSINDVNKYLMDSDNIQEMEFIEIENKLDKSRFLYNYIMEHNIPDSNLIFYFFDN